MVRVVDCHAGVLGSNRGGPKLMCQDSGEPSRALLFLKTEHHPMDKQMVGGININTISSFFNTHM